MSLSEPLTLDPTGSDHRGEHRTLRARGPATRVDILGVTAWSVSEPALLKKLLTGPDVSKDGRQHWPRFAETVTTWPLALWIAVENMFTSYGGDHRRLRRMVAPSFSARRVAALGERVESMVDELLDELAATPDGQAADLRETLCYPLPIRVISELMGVPEARREGFRELVDSVFSTTLGPKEAAANTVKLYEALDALIVEKREHHGDDMTSLLIAARDEEGDGSALSETELRDTLLLMISAGYETTVNLLDQAITALLTHPEQLAHVREGRATWTDVVEETLRYEPAVKHLPLRFAVRDIPLPDGQVINKGDAVLPSYAAANRHPDWHGESADSFELTRSAPGPEHLAFGYGTHFCLGAPLARLEGTTALEKFFARFPDAELGVPVTELRPVPSLITNGHQTLPVVLRPAG
ncbi:cytochrome P450 [Streptomyces diacarni]|uniref:Cytochrome P450 n=1 Tax=Streptomyces diacarni TaxID=2800381 RepID=A0A367EYC7_9ACTN|nr:cytochrome P450 [Streptomyces diacarni]RCG23021.1 cytochrome P450 [Streptomyces diacarni]